MDSTRTREQHNFQETASAQNKNTQHSAQYYQKLSKTLATLDFDSIDHAVNMIRKAWQNGKQIICFGNGGSALTAQHFVTDWNKSIFLSSGKPFRGRCLTENMGLIMAFGNDIGFDDVLVLQLQNIIEPGDLVIGISGSGNSKNVLRAIEYANNQGNPTLGLCGYDGGKLMGLVQHTVLAPIHDMQIAEDVHFTFGHIVMQALCQKQL